MKWQPVFPKAGDIVRINLYDRFYHYGIFVSDDEVIQFGLPPTSGSIMSGESVKVLASDIDAFRAGKFVEVGVLSSAERKKARKPQEVVDYARSKIGEGGYHIIHNNCEHFANECLFGKGESSQMEDVRKLWKNMLGTYAYVAQIPDSCDTKGFAKSRADEISAVQNEKVRVQKAFVWKLLAFAMKDAFGLKLEKTDAKKESCGKWTCSDCYFSLSHTDGYAAVAVSKLPVGVDVEVVKDKDYSLEYARIACENEKIECVTPEEFISLWTAKESIFKSKCEDVFVPSAIDTTGEKTRAKLRTEKPYDGVVMSVFGSGKCEIYCVNDKFKKKKL